MSTHDFGDLPTLRANLDALAERDSPVSAVDIRAARRAGDRVKLRRTTGRIGAAAAVAAASALCLTILPSPLHGSSSTITPATPAAPPVDQQAIPLVPGQDPVHQVGEFGWLPPGFTPLPGMAEIEQDVTMGAQGPSVPEGQVTLISNFSVSVQLTPGTREGSSALGTVLQTSTLTVDGQPATLRIGLNPQNQCETSTTIEPPGTGPNVAMSGVLTWMTANGGPAELDSCLPQNTSVTDAAAIMAHVAQKLSFIDTPVPMPFYLKDIPPTMGVEMWDGSTTWSGVENWSFSMSLDFARDKGFAFSVTPQDSSAAHTPANDGLCEDEGGLQICVFSIVNVDPLPPQLARVGYPGLLDDIVGLGTNPANWTIDVVR